MSEIYEAIKSVFNWSAFIATLAFLVAAHQAWISRQHNKLSVQPLICDLMNEESDGLLYSIINKGHGVAKVESFNYYWDGKKITDEELREKIIPYLKGKDRLKIHNMGQSFCISSNEPVEIIELKIESENLKDNPNDRFETLLKLLVTNCRVKMEYKSLYNEAFSFETSTSAIDLSQYKERIKPPV